MDSWEPATEAEAAMREVLRAGDQEQYFQVLARLDLLLPVSADSAGRRSPGWGTWSSDGRTHVLAFTSAHSMRACLAEHARSYRVVPFRDLAAQWPNPEWWLAINPGLPIEGYLPAWFVAQISQGDVRLPGRTAASRGRIDNASTGRARAVAQVPRRNVPADSPGSAPPPVRATASVHASAPVPSPTAFHASRTDGVTVAGAEAGSSSNGPNTAVPAASLGVPVVTANTSAEPATAPAEPVTGEAERATAQDRPAAAPVEPEVKKPDAPHVGRATVHAQRVPGFIDPTQALTGEVQPALGLGARLAQLQADSGGLAVHPVEDAEDRPPASRQPDNGSDRPPRGLWEPKVAASSDIEGPAELLHIEPTAGEPATEPPALPGPRVVPDQERGSASAERVSLAKPAASAEPGPSNVAEEEAEPAVGVADYPTANQTEEELLAASRSGNTDGFLSTLLLAKVLVPGYTTDSAEWPTEEISGDR